MILTRIWAPALALIVLGCEPSSDGTSDASSSTGDASGSTGDEPTGSTGDEPTGSTGGMVDLPGLHFGFDIWPIFNASCSCHIIPPDGMTPGQAVYPFMGGDPAGAYAVLINQPSTVTGLDYVEPGDSATSYLFHKVSGTAAEVGGYGDAMPPPPDMPLSAAKIATIKEWIDTGALE
ncbi:hypothetical protein [Nannocystis sp.]|uniref:hypothetical protein n=1 Tax=Nannocystis sp. TaxID=1962667 RepID=UPI0025E96B7E|nr:hypothetical protein [Nannocystis sp.]MBK7828662.1 hypothetical protein [Nannocystis sp.]